MQSIIITALIAVVLSFTCCVAYGQTFSEWWQQKKTRIKYLRQQVAILETLKQTMEKGYREAEEGVDSIGTTTGKELALHEQFLMGLKLVKPALKSDPEVETSKALAIALTRRVAEMLTNYIQLPGFTDDDMRWLRVYVSEILSGMKDDITELDQLTADDVFEMSDAERYKRIHVIASDVQTIYKTGMSFLSQMEEILIMRQTKANDDFLRGHL